MLLKVHMRASHRKRHLLGVSGAGFRVHPHPSGGIRVPHPPQDRPLSVFITQGAHLGLVGVQFLLEVHYIDMLDRLIGHTWTQTPAPPFPASRRAGWLKALTL